MDEHRRMKSSSKNIYCHDYNFKVLSCVSFMHHVIFSSFFSSFVAEIYQRELSNAFSFRSSHTPPPPFNANELYSEMASRGERMKSFGSFKWAFTKKFFAILQKKIAKWKKKSQESRKTSERTNALIARLFLNDVSHSHLPPPWRITEKIVSFLILSQFNNKLEAWHARKFLAFVYVFLKS